VLKSGSGAALLKNTAHALKVIEAVVAASSVPVTIKVRTGWDANSFVAAELARAAEGAGVSAVTVHGRHAKQGFSGRADYSAIRRVKEAVSIPVIGNGDVLSASDARRMVDETGCDLVMIGRGALGDPWIFREVESYLSTGVMPGPPTSRERGAVLVGHARAVVARLGERVGVRMMRKHGAWYSKGMTGSAEFRKLVNHAETLAQLECAASEFFGLDPVKAG
jgi:nifR3 family TIM-barrel protein